VRIGELGNGRGVDDEIDVVDLEPRVLQRHLGRFVPEIGRRESRVDLAVDASVVHLADVGVLVGSLGQAGEEPVRARRDASLLDPRPLSDPLIGGREAAREEVIVDHALRQRHPGADDLRLFHVHPSAAGLAGPLRT
jgi:hypothetical protein